MKYEFWINGNRQDETFASRDAANAEAARRRGNADRMAVVVCVAGAGRLDDNQKLIVDRDMDRGRSVHAAPEQACLVPAPQPTKPDVRK